MILPLWVKQEFRKGSRGKYIGQLTYPLFLKMVEESGSEVIIEKGRF